MIGEIEVKGHNSGARANKKKKDSTAVKTQLITSNEMASRNMIRENGRKKKEGENCKQHVIRCPGMWHWHYAHSS